MPSTHFIKPEDILRVTHGGLDIICDLYPDARKANEAGRNRKFRLRDDPNSPDYDKTPSTSLFKKFDADMGFDVYLVTDFGGEQKPRNAIGCYAKERGIEWAEALQELALQYGVGSDLEQAGRPRADYQEAPADTTEEEGTWTFNVREKFTDFEIEALLSKGTLRHIGWYQPDKRRSRDGEDAYELVQKVCNRYRLYPLESYTVIKNFKRMTFSANERYPMFVIQEETHKKIYQPRHEDKGRRFMYHGQKPKSFIHGLAQAKAEMDRREEEELERYEEAKANDPDGKHEKGKAKKLPEILMCSGASDAINVALLGYWVLWQNSESEPLEHFQFEEIKKVAYKVFQLQDIDDTGRRVAHEKALKHMDMLTIELPESLKQRKDPRGYPCKDVRDYLNYENEYAFKQLVEDALPYRFWEMERTSKPPYNANYEIKNTRLYNFLNKMGFHRIPLEGEKNEYAYVRVEGNIVRRISPNRVKNFINDFLKERRSDENLRDTVYRSPQLNESSMSNLDEVNFDFTDFDALRQFFFFENCSWEITAEAITPHKPGHVKRYVWENNVIAHPVQLLEQPPFAITLQPDGKSYDIVVNHYGCLFFNYLIQTSRIHWRRELETELDKKTEAERAAYLKENQFNIEGPLLTEEERWEQKQHLINKIFSLGYLMHRYKDRSKAWAVVGMDSRYNTDGRSYGGSGKSLALNQGLTKILRTSFKIPGTNPRITENPHIFHGLTRHQKITIIDDADSALSFRFFFEYINGDQVVNPKQNAPYEIPFDELCKLVWLTNFAFKSDGSTNRRILYNVFSDYFHTKSDTDDYRCSWEPKDEFGKTLFTQFTPEEWNHFYNTMARCVQYFLTTTTKVDPPMSAVTKRNLQREMGLEFENWANVYFSSQGDALDRFILRSDPFSDWKHNCSFRATPQQFSRSLEAFCRYHGYALNPEELRNTGDGRIMHRVKVRKDNDWSDDKKPQELLYIQTRFEDNLNRALPGEQDLPF